ncbi:MAG: HD domain-containing protein [Candidatus Woesearchaeota archaeon]
MKQLTISNARSFAIERFKSLPELQSGWNIVHSEAIIKMLDVLCEGNKEKLSALAWVHDIGKTVGEENHAELSIKILKEEFELDETDIDCITNHGSSGKPKTEEGKIFRYADGLSLFCKESADFRFYAEAKEGLSKKQIMDEISKSYAKYKEKYADSEKVINLLENLFSEINQAV